MRKILNLTVLLIMTTVFSQAQDENVWTLKRCIDYALENNIDIKRQELQMQISEKDLTQSKFNLLPDLGAAAEHRLSSGRSLNTENYEWENAKIQQGSMGLRSNVTLFSGFQNINTIKQNRFLFLSSQENFEAIKNERILALVAYYLNVLFSEELLEVAQNQLEVTLLEVVKNEKLVEVGNIAKSELFAIHALAATDKLNVTMAKNNLQLATLDLTQLLDLDSIGDFKVFKPEINIELFQRPEDVSKIYEEGVSFLPQIKSAEYQVEAQKKLVAVNRGSRSPELYISGLYYSRYLKDAINPEDPYWQDPMNLLPSLEYNYGNQLKNNQYSQLTVGFSLPIFSKMQLQTDISKSKIVLQDYKYSLQQQKQSLYKTIQQYHADATAAFDKYSSALEAVVSNEEAFNYMQQKFNVGLVNSIDFNVAKNNLTKARSDLVQSKYEYIFKVKILDFYRGKAIQL